MVKKANTDKPSKNKKDEQYVGIKQSDVKKTADLIVQQDEMIRQLRMMVERKDKTLTVISEQRDKYMAQRDFEINKSKAKDALFFAMTDLCQDALELDIDDSCRRAKAFKIGFWVSIVMNVFFATIHFFAC